MKFNSHKIFCTKCGHRYDDCLSECPKCHQKNRYLNPITQKTNIFWLDPLRQGMLFAVGFLGFQFVIMLFSVMFTIIAKTSLGDPILVEEYLRSSHVNMSLNLLCYISVFIAIIIIVWPFLNQLFAQFVKGKTWLYGLVGGVVLIFSSIIYGQLINLVYPTEGNVNQENVTNLIALYPFASILLFGFAGPIVEEFTYRLGCFSFLRRWNRLAAYILTILIFGLIHFNWQFTETEELINELINLPTYIIAGGVLCFIYEKSSWAGSSIAHIVNNLYACVVTLILANL